MTNEPQSMPEDETSAAPADGDAAADARVAALEAEHAEMKDRVLRTMAEMENLRRRTERQIAETRQYAIAAFARDMLTAGDNLARALTGGAVQQHSAIADPFEVHGEHARRRTPMKAVSRIRLQRIRSRHRLQDHRTVRQIRSRR